MFTIINNIYLICNDPLLIVRQYYCSLVAFNSEHGGKVSLYIDLSSSLGVPIVYICSKIYDVQCSLCGGCNKCTRL